MSCDGTRQEQKIAKMEQKDGTGGNTKDKRIKRPRDTGYTEPRAAHKSTIWINI